VVLTAAGTSSYSTEPTAASGARGKIRGSTSAMRQLRSDPGAVDRFGDAIGREPVRCWVMIREAQIPFPSGDFRPGASRCTPFRCVRRRRLGRHGCQSCDLGSAVIKSVGQPGCAAHVGMRARAPCFAVTSCAAQRLRCDIWTVVISADGRGRVDLTREGMGCVYGRTATRWRIASGLVAGVLLLHNSATQCASKSPPTVLWSMSSRVHTVTTGNRWRGCVAGWRAPDAPSRW
jgi:hypothetical protein